jgi:hypothetical protein
MAADEAMARRLVSVTVPSMGEVTNANFASCEADGFLRQLDRAFSSRP